MSVALFLAPGLVLTQIQDAEASQSEPPAQVETIAQAAPAFTPTVTPTVSVNGTAEESVVLVGAGDIANCEVGENEQKLVALGPARITGLTWLHILQK